MSVDVFCCQVRLSSFLFKLKHQQNPLDIKDIGIQVDPYLRFIILTLIHGENALIGGNFKIFGRAVFEVIEVKFRYFDLKFFRQKRTALNLKIEQTIKFKPLITKDFRAARAIEKLEGLYSTLLRSEFYLRSRQCQCIKAKSLGFVSEGVRY